MSKSVDPSTVSIRRRSAVLLSSAAALFLALSSSTGAGIPDPDEPSLEELNERIAALEEEYDAEL